MWKREIHIRLLVGKPEDYTPEPRYRWTHIKVDHRVKGWGGMDWTHLSQDRNKWTALVKLCP
jgi:hypothetical protein